MIGSRRHFFTALARMVAKTALPEPRHDAGPAAPARGQGASPQALWLRPPGALREPDFLEACTRCTDCQQACPHEAIRRLGPEFGPAGGTPAIIPTESPCYLCDDLPCIAACMPGALRPIDRRAVEMGRAKLDADACYLSQGQPCDYCVARCPLKGEAISFVLDGPPRIHAACVGCGVCAYLCPADALAIVPGAASTGGESHGSAR